MDCVGVRTILLILLMILVACTVGPAAGDQTPSPSGSGRVAMTPWPAAATVPCAPGLPNGSPPLMALLEATGDSAYPNKVVIAGLDLIGRARALFQPRHYPVMTVPDAQYPTLSPHMVYAVRGTVYFIDGYGTVFRMGVDGKQTVVTQFLIGLEQQEVSFAVSPDGCQLAAAVLTLPPAPAPVAAGQSPAPLSGKWTLQTMSATAGSPAQVLHTWTSTDYPNSKSSAAFANLVLVGWDSTGPIAVVGSNLGEPANAFSVPISNRDFVGGFVTHLGGDGTPGRAIAFGGCTPAQVSPAGDVTCYTSTAAGMRLSVLSTTGGTQLAPTDFALEKEGLYEFSSPTVAVGPNGQIAVSGQIKGPVQTYGKERAPNSSGGLPQNFLPEGWVDGGTVFGRLGEGNSGGHNGNAAMLRLDPVLKAEDLGFKGHFVGMLG
jgi:hypothetical protein